MTNIQLLFGKKSCFFNIVNYMPEVDWHVSHVHLLNVFDVGDAGSPK